MRRRTLIKTTAKHGTGLLGGCSGSDSYPDDGSTASGTFRLLISDQPVAIEDFDSPDVTRSAARVFRADEDKVDARSVQRHYKRKYYGDIRQHNHRRY